MAIRFFSILSAVFCASTASAADAKIVVRQLNTPNSAAVSAAADVSALLASAAQAGAILDGSTFRYIWIPDANEDDRALCGYVANAVLSRSDLNFAPGKPSSPIQYLDGGNLVRLDFSRLATEPAELREVLDAWDAIRNPYFLLEREVETQLKTSVTPYRSTEDGKVYDWRWQTQKVKVRECAPHIDLQAAATLQTLTASRNPIVWCRTLYEQALTQADGGLYYRFTGIRRANADERRRGLSDLDVLLLKLGVPLKTVDKLRADQRAAMIKSEVTGKPRRIDVFDRPAPTSKTQGLVWITHDVNDHNFAAGADPFLNLLEFADDGREIIFERNNGHHAYLLTDASGNLVNSAPDVLVRDFEVPRPYTSRLEPAISCVRCHGKAGEEGLKAFSNQVKAALDGTLNVFDDAGGRKQGLDVIQTLEKLSRLYSGDLAKPLRRAREDHSDAIVVSVGAKQWQFEDVAQALAERFVYYRYSLVDPAKALLELGYETDAEHAPQLLRDLLGEPPQAHGSPVKIEDVRIGLLRSGMSITRLQWELVYADAAIRARLNAPTVLPAQQPKP